MKKELEYSKQMQWMIRINMKRPDGIHFDGIVVERKKSLVILREIVDFEADGLLVLPKKWIKSIRNGKHETCANEILRCVSPFGGGSESEWYLNVETVEEIVNSLKTANIWPGIGEIYKGKPALHVGAITEVSERSFKLYCYDTVGNWEEEEFELEYDQLFKIEINSRYIRHFNEYMRMKGMPVEIEGRT